MVPSLFAAALLLFAGGDASSAKSILKDLRSPEYGVRKAAVLAVEGRSEPALLSALLTVAKEDDHPAIRGATARVLATFEDSRVFPALADLVATATYPITRREAYLALGRLGDARGRAILTKGLRDGEETRAWAAAGLGHLGHAEDFDAVRRLLVEHPRDRNVVDMVPEALVRIDRKRAAAFLLERFASSTVYDRDRIAELLVRYPVPGLRLAMERHLRSENESLRRTAIQMLGALRDPEVIPKLLGSFPPDSDDHRWVLAALGEIGTKEAVLPLMGASRSRQEFTRQAALRSLSRVRDRGAVPLLLRLLAKEKDAGRRVALIVALGRCGDPRTMATLVPCLSDASVVYPVDMRVIVDWGWPFPVYVSVRSVAVWSILSLRDGKEPFGVKTLGGLRRPKEPARIEGDVKAIRQWWKKASADAQYRLPE